MEIAKYNISHSTQYMDNNPEHIEFDILFLIPLFILYINSKKNNNKIRILEDKISTHANIIKELHSCLIGQETIINKFIVLYQKDMTHYNNLLEKHRYRLTKYENALIKQSYNILHHDEDIHKMNIQNQQDKTYYDRLLNEHNMAISLINNLEYDMPICIGKISTISYKSPNASNSNTLYSEAKPIYVSSLIETINFEDYIKVGNGSELQAITLYIENFIYLKKIQTFNNPTPYIQNILYHYQNKNNYNPYHKPFTFDDIIHLPIEVIIYNCIYVEYQNGIQKTKHPRSISNDGDYPYEYNKGDNDKLLNSIDNLYKFSKLNTIYLTNMQYSTEKLSNLLDKMNFRILEQTFDPSNKDITWSIHATRI